ncbi:MAG: hypothetical protein ACTSUE_13145 [Promethearchaeota archaeon]
MWSLFTSVLFGIFGIICLKIAYQHYKKKLSTENIINDVAMGIIFLLCGITFPFMYVLWGTPVSWQETFFLITWVVLFSFIWFLSYFIIKGYIMVKRKPELKESRGYTKFLEIRKEEFGADPRMRIKMDNNRKVLHLIPVGVICGSFIIASFLEMFGVIPLELVVSFGLFLIVLIGYAFCTMFMMAEILRLVDDHNHFHLAPDWAHQWFRSSITDDEIQSFISSIPIVLCLMPFVFAPVPIFIAVGCVACISDAAASMFGKRFGKREIKLNPPKTYAGLIAGGVVTFFSVLVPMAVLPLPPMNLNWGLISLMAAGTSAVFIVIDVFAKYIGDNFLNPLMCGAFMVLFYSFF